MKDDSESGNKLSSYKIEGDRRFGDEKVLLHSDDDLTANTDWHAAGFTVTRFLKDQDYNELLAGLRNRITNALLAAKILVPENFRLEDYHKLVGNDQAKHLQVINKLTKLPTSDFPVPVELVSDAISEQLKIPVVAVNKQNGLSNFHLRVVRPHMPDFNPLHRDVWLDRLRNGINLYVPVAGSTAQSSLQVVPGSHLWSEAETERTLAGAIMQNQQFSVPAVTAARRKIEPIRPNPQPNQVLIFSPYLIHGEGSNLSKDTTRFSLELRLWRK